MIAACPRCSARYRVDRERLGPDGARLRCAKCQAVFRVRPPTSSDDLVAPPEPVAAPQAPAPAAPPAAAAGGSESVPPDVDRDRLVVVADPEVDAGKRTASAIASWGLQPILVHDGVEAMLTIQRTLPRAVVLDAALPKMYGFQICEVLKRNDALRDIRVALVGAIHHQGRYRRPPTDLYGADAYVERPDLPDALDAVLRGWGLPVARSGETTPPGAHRPEPVPEPVARPAPVPEPVAPAAPVPEPVAPPAPMPESLASPTPTREPAAPTAPVPEPVAPVAPMPEPEVGAADELADERAKADRLARIIVSDIALYNPEKFEQGIRDGDVARVLEAELAEGRSLFCQRIDPRVRDERDHLVEELVRVARERGMK